MRCFIDLFNLITLLKVATANAIAPAASKADGRLDVT